MHNAISELFRISLLIIGALFPIVNPVDNIPIFLSLTSGLSSSSRIIMSRKIAMYGFMLLIGSVLIGTHILTFFGISLPVVQVGGGLVVIAAGWSLLNKKDEDGVAREKDQKQVEASYLSKRAFYPLTLPLTVGPGSISVAIAVGANRPPGSEARWYLPVAAVIGCAALAVIIYLTYRFAEPIGRVVGETSMNIIVRLSSFILVCIGVQITWNGAGAMLHMVLVNSR
jgi:multiple antibiotic resistance protein